MAKKNQSWSLFRTIWEKNIVKDETAPQLYSRLVLNVFSILFSVLFGGILLVLNLKTIGKKEGIPYVLTFSALYTALVIFLANLGHHGNSTVLVVGLNGVGAVVLYNYFWGKYIGSETDYRTKPFAIPLVIALVITAVLFFLAIAGGQLK